jgi:hypothetical protein
MGYFGLPKADPARRFAKKSQDVWYVPFAFFSQGWIIISIEGITQLNDVCDFG